MIEIKNYYRQSINVITPQEETEKELLGESMALLHRIIKDYKTENCDFLGPKYQLLKEEKHFPLLRLIDVADVLVAVFKMKNINKWVAFDRN